MFGADEDCNPGCSQAAAIPRYTAAARRRLRSGRVAIRRAWERALVLSGGLHRSIFVTKPLDVQVFLEVMQLPGSRVFSG